MEHLLSKQESRYVIECTQTAKSCVKELRNLPDADKVEFGIERFELGTAKKGSFWDRGRGLSSIGECELRILSYTGSK